MKRARRLPWRRLRCRARRALLASGLLLAAASAPVAASDIIQAAHYAEPTTRYAHGVLGDAVESGALSLTVGACKGCADAANRTVLIRLPETRVFEDTAPRLADLDGDGAPEVIVVESDLSLGARIAVYDASGLITATPFIGRAFRWLAPLGAADLDGDGTTEIAYIDRPHLARTLRVWRYADRSLSEVASLPGLTNHRIGESHISGGIRDCGDGPEIVTVDAAWRTIMATRLQDGRLSARPLGPFRGAVPLEDAVACK